MMFHDDYIDKEENLKICDIILKLLLTGTLKTCQVIYIFVDEIKLNVMDANDPEISEYFYVPSTKTLANEPRPCFEVYL